MAATPERAWRLARALGVGSLALLVGLGWCACLTDGLGGSLGVIDGQEFEVASGGAYEDGGGLEIELSDAPGEGCEGSLQEPEDGARMVVLSVPQAVVGTYSTDEGARITIQRRREGQVLELRQATGLIEIEDVGFEGSGWVSGYVQATTPEGDQIEGSFQVDACP